MSTGGPMQLRLERLLPWLHGLALIRSWPDADPDEAKAVAR